MKLQTTLKTIIIVLALTLTNHLNAQKLVGTLDEYFTKLFQNGQLNGNVINLNKY